ncbi:hypothetical protein L1049_000407 [Liquidambar formosana]|uniref:Uncharacterized protein n=1 Tax=Liquidambar formosana TaxID=63359 RepID=A0AAP0R4S7_LIQFO
MLENLHVLLSMYFPGKDQENLKVIQVQYRHRENCRWNLIMPDEQSLPCSVHSPRVERIPSVSKDPVDSNLNNAQTGSIESAMNAEDSMMEEKLNGLADDRANNSQVHDDGLVEESSNPKLAQGNLKEGEKILA